MFVLALDTTGPHCSVAIARGGDVLAHISEPMRRGQVERLAPMVAEAMAQAGVSADQIDRLAVCTGPGSFTGLRVALSYAKGFALPRRLDVIGVDALEITARDIFATDAEARLVVMRDIRRSEVMACTYEHGLSTREIGVMSEEDAVSLASDLDAPIVESIEADMSVLATYAATLDPADYPAVPLYARAPDAKLPGGASLPA